MAAWAAAAGRLRVTDDTVLALVLAKHLVGRGARVDQDALALELARACLPDPGRGYGGAVQHLFARVLEGALLAGSQPGPVRRRRVVGQRRGHAGRTRGRGGRRPGPDR